MRLIPHNACIILPVLLTVSGCAAARAAQPAVSNATASAQPREPSEADGLLSRMLTPIADTLRAEGFKQAGPPTHGFLAPSARMTEPFTLAPRTCVAIAALATATVTDLDAAIYAEDGSALAEDDTTGARPIVRLCAGETRLDAYLAFYAFQGTGSFAALRFERPLTHVDALGLAEAARASGDTDLTPGFNEVLRGLRARGYEDDGPISEVPLVHGSAVRLTNHVEAGHCYSALADGPGLRLRLIDAAGREVALGVGTTGPAALQYCAREDADLLLELSAAGPGGQSARLVRLHAGQATVGSARAVWLGEPSSAFAVGTRNAKVPGGQAECASGRSARAPHKAVPLFSAAALSQGHVLERELRLSGCSLLVATLEQGLAVATLRVEDSAGRTLAERDLLAPRDSLAVCPTEAGAQRVTVIARAGFGALSLTLQGCGD